MDDLTSPQAKLALLTSETLNIEAIGILNEADLAECLLTAAYRGNLALMRDLMRHRGTIPLKFEHTRLNPNQFILNDRPFALDKSKHLSHIKSTKDLKELLTAIEEFGLKGLVEPGPTYPLLLREIDSRVKIFRLTEAVFSGLLPELRQDTLSSPELAIALGMESEGPVTPYAYKPILCWASKDMVRQFPERLAPLRPYQRVSVGQSMKEFKASFNPEKPEAPLIITVGVHGPRSNAYFTKFLFRLMAPESTHMGFDDDAGRVLCETTTDFLLSFPAVNHIEENHRAARAFVECYCPFEIIATQAATICARDFGHKAPNYWFKADLHTQFSYGDSRLFEMLRSDHPLRDRALNMMEMDQWLWLVRKFDAKHSTARCLLALRDTFGMDNTSLKLILTQSKIDQLLASGYRFADETSVFDNQGKFDYACTHTYETKCKTTAFLKFDVSDWRPPNADQMTERQVQDHIVEQYQKILQANLWPSVTIRPTDVEVAIKMLATYEKVKFRYNTTIALHAYLKNAGIEACVQAAAPEHWPRLLDVFSREAFDPYLKKLPQNARGRLLEDDMGL